jgi:uncharacterized membrane protein
MIEPRLGLAELRAWSGFVGIFIELLGFVVLTVDLLPDYLVYRRKRQLEEFKRLASNDAWYQKETNEDPVLQVASGALFLVEISPLLSLMRWSGSLDQDRIRGLTQPDRAAIESAIASVEAGIARKEMALSARWRPPLLLGIAFVLFGVAGQLFGAWPLK